MKVACGDTLRLDLERIPIYATSGPGRGRQTTKVVTVQRICKHHAIVSDGNRVFRLYADVGELSGEHARYTVLNMCSV